MKSWPSVLILFFVQAKLPHNFIPGPALLYFKGSTLNVWTALLFVGKWGKTTYLSTAHSTILHYSVTMVTWCMENKCRVLTRGGRLTVEGLGQLNLLSFSDEAVCSSQFSMSNFLVFLVWKSLELSNENMKHSNFYFFFAVSRKLFILLAGFTALTPTHRQI